MVFANGLLQKTPADYTSSGAPPTIVAVNNVAGDWAAVYQDVQPSLDLAQLHAMMRYILGGGSYHFADAGLKYETWVCPTP